MADRKPPKGYASHDRYSKVVRVLRWVLPTVAILLLGSIFLLSNTNKLREALIIPDIELAELAIGQKITNPHFAGVTKSGDAFSISADWALPDGPAPERIDLFKPETTIDFENGRTMRTSAGAGALNLITNEAILREGVDLQTADGVTAHSAAIVINFETGNVYSNGPVTARGKIGSIDAGSMSLLQNLDRKPSGHAVLMFKNGVKLIYKPQTN